MIESQIARFLDELVFPAVGKSKRFLKGNDIVLWQDVLYDVVEAFGFVIGPIVSDTGGTHEDVEGQKAGVCIGHFVRDDGRREGSRREEDREEEEDGEEHEAQEGEADETGAEPGDPWRESEAGQRRAFGEEGVIVVRAAGGRVG